MEKKEIILKNKLSEIRRISEIIEKFCENNDLPMRILFDVNLSLDELLTNIIHYGFDDEKEHTIIVKLSLYENILEITIEDDGKAFNPLNAKPPNLDQSIEDKPIGGLGIYLVKNLMTEINYKRLKDKNILVLTKIVTNNLKE